MPRAIVLLSGGLDSATVLAMARASGADCICLSFDYAQRHKVELDAAARIASSLGASEHVVFPLDTRIFSGSALTDGPAPDKRDASESLPDGIPSTYVPARNLVMLSIATALAESRGAGEVHIGVNAIDYSGYPDCRPEFIEAFGSAANLATRAGIENSDTPAIRVRTPLIDKTKAEIIHAGTELRVDYAMTCSCYDPDEHGRACGSCDACILRRRGFEDAGVSDPTRYKPGASR